MDCYIANELYSILYDRKPHTIHGTPINNLKNEYQNNKSDKDVRDQQTPVNKAHLSDNSKDACA